MEIHIYLTRAVIVLRDAVRLEQTGVDEDGFPIWAVRSSNFMVFHTILRTSEDYTEALRWARKLTDDIMETVS